MLALSISAMAGQIVKCWSLQRLQVFLFFCCCFFFVGTGTQEQHWTCFSSFGRDVGSWWRSQRIPLLTINSMLRNETETDYHIWRNPQQKRFQHDCRHTRAQKNAEVAGGVGVGWGLRGVKEGKGRGRGSTFWGEGGGWIMKGVLSMQHRELQIWQAGDNCATSTKMTAGSRRSLCCHHRHIDEGEWSGR